MNNQLSIWERINECPSVPALKATIIDIWGNNGVIQGRSEPFTVNEMLQMIDEFVEDHENKEEFYRSLPTRQFGIRQQLLLILEKPVRR